MNLRYSAVLAALAVAVLSVACVSTGKARNPDAPGGLTGAEAPPTGIGVQKDAAIGTSAGPAGVHQAVISALQLSSRGTPSDPVEQGQAISLKETKC